MASAVARPAEWIAPETIQELSRSFRESSTSSARREDAYRRFLTLPLEPDPLYRGYGYFTNVDLSGADPVHRAAEVPVPPAADGVVQVIHDAAGTRAHIPDAAKAAGTHLTVLDADGGSDRSSATEPEEPVDRLTALSTALRNRGYVLEVPARTASPVRVQDITILSRPHEALSVRRSVKAGQGAQVLFTEEVYSTGATFPGQRFYASTSDVELADRAKVVWLTVHAPDLRVVSAYQRTATTGADARLGWLWNGLGGFRTKAKNFTRLVGHGSNVEDLQMFYGSGEQSYDSAVHLTHQGTDTHGQSITRGVFSDSARGMSRGLVRIEKQAAKTLSFISEHAMLLSRGARSDTIPILEILCRDVKATHSTSVHPVDPEQVFYLESRGIGTADAVRMIGEGFLSYVLDRAPIPSLRDVIFPAMEARWNREELPWTADGARALPALDVTGTEASPEWRFDTKLR